MTLLRLIARPMLAAVFISSGVKHIRNPEPHVAVAKPVTDRIMPAVKKFTPPQLVDQIPDDAATLVRINGAIQVAGGVALATGKYRRLGAFALAASLVPTTLAGHPFWKDEDPEQRAANKVQFMKNLGLGGGLLLALGDTEGKPGLLWRARHARNARKASKQAAKASRSVPKAPKPPKPAKAPKAPKPARVSPKPAPSKTS